MLVQRRVMRWKIIWKSFQAVSANGFIFSFTLLLALKLDHLLSHSWWFVFTPLWWLCHAIISRGRCSLPSPPMPHDENWTPFHYVMAMPLLVAFEILLFLHLEDKYDDLKFVFLPLLAFEVAILVYNVRKCLTCMPRYEETMSEEPLLKYEQSSFFSIYSISECFGFLVTKWRNQSIHRSSHIPSSSSVGVRYRNEDSNRECDILDIGGYVMKIPFITFQNILFLSLEGTSASPKNIPIVVLVGGPYGRSFARSSSSVFLRFFQHGRRYFAASTARIFRGLFQHGVRLLGCWSVDEGSQEEQARLYTGEATGYNTFSPEVVKKMPKSDLVEEVRRLQAALSEQTDISKQEYEKLQDVMHPPIFLEFEKILCKVCIVEPIDVVLLPCKHRALCRCPKFIGERRGGALGFVSSLLFLQTSLFSEATEWRFHFFTVALLNETASLSVYRWQTAVIHRCKCPTSMIDGKTQMGSARVASLQSLKLDVFALQGLKPAADLRCHVPLEAGDLQRLNHEKRFTFPEVMENSCLFDDDGEGTRFVSGASVSKIILKLEESAKVVIFTVRKKDCWVRLEGSRQGVKGALTIAEEMFELTPSLVVVENLTADDVKEPVAVSAVDVIVSSLDMLER
ncbi:hypothetical protein Bca101_048933 [Brassica carinata]